MEVDDLCYRDMKEEVYLITGGTGCVGSKVVRDLAGRGARLILLCRDVLEPKITSLIKKVRKRNKNNHIYAVNCNLEHSSCVAAFVREWLKPKEPRRLDGIICCATYRPKGSRPFIESDCKDSIRKVNHLHQMYLLDRLRPAFLLQPSNRRVRIIIVTTGIYNGNLWKGYPPFKSRKNLFQLVNKKLTVNENVLSSWRLYFQSQNLLGLYGNWLQTQLYVSELVGPQNIDVLVVYPFDEFSEAYKNYWPRQHKRLSKISKKIKVLGILPKSRHSADYVRFALFYPFSKLKQSLPAVYYPKEQQDNKFSHYMGLRLKRNLDILRSYQRNQNFDLWGRAPLLPCCKRAIKDVANLTTFFTEEANCS